MISKRKDNDTYEENLDVPKDTNIGLNKQKGFLCSVKQVPTSQRYQNSLSQCIHFIQSQEKYQYNFCNQSVLKKNVSQNIKKRFKKMSYEGLFSSLFLIYMV